MTLSTLEISLSKTNMTHTLRLCHIESLKQAKSLGFELDSCQLFAVFVEESIAVYRNSCPHLGLPLEFMPDRFLNVDNSLIQCATHGALFLPETGECISGPCHGQFLQPVPHQIVDDYLCISSAALPATR